MAARRWMRPMVLPGVAAIADLARISETQCSWSVLWRPGMASPAFTSRLMWQHSELSITAQPLVACAAQARDQAVAVGLKGAALRVTDGRLSVANAQQPVDLWSAAIDSTGGRLGWRCRLRVATNSARAALAASPGRAS